MLFLASTGIIGDIFNALRGIKFSQLLVGFLFYLASQLIRALRWWFLLNTRLDWTISVSFVNVMFNNLLPARLGELSWFYFAKKAKIELIISFWVFLIARGFDLLSASVFLLLSIGETFIAVFLLILAFFLILVIKNFRVSAFRYLNNLSLKSYMVVFWLSILSMFLKFLGFIWMFNLWQELKVVSISFIGSELHSVLPFYGFAGFGTFEAIFVLPASLRGEEITKWLTIGSAYHIILLLFSIFLGVCGMLYLRRFYISNNICAITPKN
ncbi:MAG: hypothetical protein RMJ32_03575 [Aquificaceae bacterium]|nr:hypothetical protein [Aquificaceae bacterium]